MNVNNIQIDKLNNIMNDNNIKFEILNRKIDILDSKLDNINKELKEILLKLNDISKNTNKMDSHIDFVDGVYLKVQRPFHSLMNLVSNKLLFGNNNKIIKE